LGKEGWRKRGDGKIRKEQKKNVECRELSLLCHLIWETRRSARNEEKKKRRRTFAGIGQRKRKKKSVFLSKKKKVLGGGGENKIEYMSL